MRRYQEGSFLDMLVSMPGGCGYHRLDPMPAAASFMWEVGIRMLPYSRFLAAFISQITESLSDLQETGFWKVYVLFKQPQHPFVPGPLPSPPSLP